VGAGGGIAGGGAPAGAPWPCGTPSGGVGAVHSGGGVAAGSRNRCSPRNPDGWSVNSPSPPVVSVVGQLNSVGSADWTPLVGSADWTPLVGSADWTPLVGSADAGI